MLWPKCTAIAACDPRGIMGKEGKLPWHCPEDLAHFYRATENSVMVMGYNTFCSLPPRVFSHRTCVVFTRNHQVDPTLALSVKDLRELENDHADLFKAPFFVIGGALLFSHFFSTGLIQEVLLTHMNQEYEGDVAFPLHFISGWGQKRVRQEKHFCIILHTKKGKNGS